ncbi:MAG TPA: tetratricopeptide repeat protein [Gemmatimonadaceae bacterium]
MALVLWLCSSAAAAQRPRAAELAAQAESASAAGRLADAVALLEQAERADPQWAELKVNLAAARSAAGDYAGAASAARAALALDPTLDGARVNLGLALLKGGDPAGAAKTLAPYAARQNAPAVAFAALGLAWMSLDRAADAAPVLQRAITAGVRDPDVLAAAVHAFLSTGNVPGARSACTLLAQAQPDALETHLLTGDVADAAQDWTTADREYRAAIAADGESALAHYSLGMILFKQRKYDAAAASFERALTLSPDLLPALQYFAMMDLDRGDARHAGTLLGRATRLAPARADLWRDLGRARLDLQDAPGALPVLRRAVALDEQDASAWFLLARALQATGSRQEAQAAFRRAATLNQQKRDALLKRVSGIGRSDRDP